MAFIDPSRKKKEEDEQRIDANDRKSRGSPPARDRNANERDAAKGRRVEDKAAEEERDQPKERARANPTDTTVIHPQPIASETLLAR